MADDQGERTEEATDLRREEFRKRGQVAHTRELVSSLFILASAACILVLSKYFFAQIYQTFQYMFGDDMVYSIRQGNIFDTLRFAGSKLFYLISPILLISGVLGIGANVIQTGFLQVEDALTPNPEKIDPLKGFSRIFSLKSLVEGLKSLLKIICIGAVVLYVLKSELFHFPQIIHYNIQQLVSYIGDLTFRVLVAVGFSMLVLSLADYIFQRWDLEKQMMMTKQEVKEEHKSREGDPQIKARIRKIQRDMSNRRMMEKVPQGTVVITNPTHIAVVLKYDDGLPAPQLIAKGADLVAEKIKEIARQHNIPVIENKPLARTIFKTLKLGQVVPRELFVAVAEVLAYVFKLKRKAIR